MLFKILCLMTFTIVIPVFAFTFIYAIITEWDNVMNGKYTEDKNE